MDYRLLTAREALGRVLVCSGLSSWAARLVITTCTLLTAVSAIAASDPILSGTVIRGSTVYTSAELFAVYRDYLGRPVERSSARAIVNALGDMYERDGYSRPRIRIDDKLVAHGILRIDVSEPRIGELTVSGDPGPHRRRLEQIGAQLQSDRALRPGEVRTVLQRMRELPGLTLAATTEPDEADPDLYRLGVEAQFEPVSGMVRVTNRGTQEIGPHFVLGQAVANGLVGERTKLGLLFAAATDYDEYHGIGGLVDLPLGESGAHASFNVFRSSSEPALQNDRYARDRASMAITRPMIDEDDRRASLFVTIDVDDLTIERSDQLLRDEQLRVIELGARWYGRSGAATQYLGSVGLRKGLGGFGSGLKATDLETDPRSEDFLLFQLSLTRLTRLNDLWSLRLEAYAQQTAYVLPYVERFKIGGHRLGRGFEVTEIAGDQGAGAKAELRRSLSSLSDALGRTSLYGFYDLGAAWKQDEGGRESAATAGFGLARDGRALSGYLELAQPLTHADVEGSDDLTLFIEITGRF